MNWLEFFQQFQHDEKEPLLFHTGIFLFIFSVFLIGFSFVYITNLIRFIAVVAFGFSFYYKESGVFLL
ncbi:MAG: MBOAT family protein, partial [Bacteroidia bacterium]|nr:MBOAT family protein [Bacteroidia bacterium]